MLTRRKLMARAGLGAAALKMAGSRQAMAASGAPTRLVIIPMLNGAEAPRFWPSPGNLSAMSAVTSPLASYQRQLTFVRGVDIEGSMNHMAVRSMFTGAPIADYLSPDPMVKSIDQVMADYIAQSAPTPLHSLHLGVIPADSIDLYQLYGRSTFFFAPKPVDYEANPVTAFDRTFKGQTGGTGATGTPSAPAKGNFDNDVLDIADAELADLGGKLSGSLEQAKIQQHRQALKDLRPAATGPVSLPMPATGMMGAAGCGGTIASVEKLRPALQGKAADAYKHTYYSDMFDAQIDIVARALTCGLTRVATIQAGSADGNVTDPVGPGYPHHQTSHGDQGIFAQCQNWYMTKYQRLMKALDVPDPLDPSGKTVLYNSVVLIMSECLPIGHESTTVPVMLGGNAGGALKAGTFADLKDVSNKALMLTILQMLGVPGSNAPQFGTTTLSELRA